MNDDVSIRMNNEDSLAPPASLFAPRPDKKGPKTISILLIMGSVLMLLIGWGDIQNSMAEDFPDADLDAILGNYQNQDINITEEEYQESLHFWTTISGRKIWGGPSGPESIKQDNKICYIL